MAPSPDRAGMQTLAALALSAALCLAPPARAQTGIALSELRVELWPEYDQPAVLVIVSGALAPEVQLPAEVSLRLPAAAGAPAAVTAMGEQGYMGEAPYTMSAEADELVVRLQLNAPRFHLEYYDPSLQVEGEARSYTFTWKADASAAKVLLQVQEPVDARGLQAAPAVVLAGTGSLGLNYYTAALGPLAQGQAFTVSLSYLKSSPALSVEKVAQARAAAAVEATRSASMSSSTPAGRLAWPAAASLGIGGAALLAAALWLIWRRGGRPA